MKSKLFVAIVAIAALTVGAQAQPKPKKATKADAQKVVALISADKAKTQIYCDLAKLGEQLDQADQKKDSKKVEELGTKMDEMTQKLGPEYAALMDGVQGIDPDSKEGKDIAEVLDGLDAHCKK